MKRFFVLILLLWGNNYLFAQSTRVTEHFALGFSLGSKQSATTVRYNQMLVFGKNHAIHAGTGLKLTAFREKEKAFNGITSKITDVKIKALPRGNMYALNIPLIFELHGKKGMIGANIDLIGITAGKKRDSLSIIGANRPDSLSIKPTLINFLGRGTNTAELYIGFKPKEELTIRFGFNLLLAEYSALYRKSSKDVDFGRFRYSSVMPFISVVFNFER